MLKPVLVGLIRSLEQSKDRHPYPELRTRYYKLSKDRAWSPLLETVRKLPRYELLHELQSVGEIVLKRRTLTGRAQDITITVVQMGPLRIAIDIYASSRGGFGDLGANYRAIRELFAVFDRQFSHLRVESV